MRRKVISNIIKVQEFLYPCGRVAGHDCEQQAQEPKEEEDHHQIIKVEEFLYPEGRVANHDWEQEPKEEERHRQHHQGTGVSLSLWLSCRP